MDPGALPSEEPFRSQVVEVKSKADCRADLACFGLPPIPLGQIVNLGQQQDHENLDTSQLGKFRFIRTGWLRFLNGYR